MKSLRLMLIAVFLGAPLMVQAEGTSSSNDFDKIQVMLEYNKRMVKMTEDYMLDRSKIPADYRDVADKEYLRKAKMEKPLASMTPAEKSKTSASAKPVKK